MNTIDTLLVERAPGQTRVAALNGESIVEVHHHRLSLPEAGAEYIGRVRKVLHSASACFVDIGLAVDAFMPYSELRPVEGDVVHVRVVQPPRRGKGAKVAKVSGVHADSGAQSDSVQVPSLVRRAPHPVSWCVDKYGDTLSKVLVSPGDSDGVIAALIPGALDLSLESTATNIFGDYEVDDALEEALGREVALPGGGRIIIEETAALTAIDIDAGPLPAAQANHQAIPVIAQQIRLRSIGGPMIIDLIPAHDRGGCVDALRATVSDDPVKTKVSGLTPEGRMELNRRRERPALSDLYLAGADHVVHGVDAVAYDILRKSVRAGLAARSVRIGVRAHQRVITALRGHLRYALDEAEAALKTELRLEPARQGSVDEFEVLTS